MICPMHVPMMPRNVQIAPAVGGFLIFRRGCNPVVVKTWSEVIEYLTRNPIETLQDVETNEIDTYGIPRVGLAGEYIVSE